MDPILPSPSAKEPQDMTVREPENALAPEDSSRLPVAPAAEAPGPVAKTALDTVLEYVRDFVVIVMVVLIVRATLVSPFKISGISMENSYRDGELIVLDHLSYFSSKNFGRELARGDIGALRTLTSRVLDLTVGWFDLKVGDPERGDVVVFRPHAGNGKDFYIKRVVGLPGDALKFRAGRVFLKPAGAPEFVKLDEAYLSVANYESTQVPGTQEEFKVPAGKYFVMGDNRQWSTDSRACFRGPAEGCPGEAYHYVDRSDVLGKVLVSLGRVSLSGNIALFQDPRWFSTPRTWNYPELEKAAAKK